MRSTIDVPESLLKDAQDLSGLRTKRDVVVAALEVFVRAQRIARLRALIGKGFALTQEDLEEMRADEYPPESDGGNTSGENTPASGRETELCQRAQS